MITKINKSIAGLAIITVLAATGFFAYIHIASAACGTGYSFCRTITIDHTKVPSTQTNFTVLVSTTTLSSLAVTGSGGNVNNTVSFNSQTVPADLVFSTTSDCGTLMSWDFDHYVTTTGEIEVWVLITSLSSSVDTTFYMCYGKVSVSTYQGGSIGAAWDSNFMAVYHLADGSSLSGKDSTTNAYNLTINSGWGAAAGQIDGATAKSNPANTEYLSNASPVSPNSITVSFWNKVLTGDPQTDAAFDFSDGSTCQNPSPRLLSHAPYSDNNIYWDYGDATGGQGRVSTSYASYLDAWTYVTEVYDSSSHLHAIYLNGTSAVSDTFTTSNPNCTGIIINRLATSYGKRQLDEFRIANAARTANWITTEYNNQFSPGTFYSVTAQQTASSAAAVQVTRASIPSGSTSITNGRVSFPGN